MWQAIKLYSSKTWTFLLPIIKIFMSQAGTTLASIALNAVQLVANGAMNNDEKKAAAFAQITDELKAKGIELGTSVINLAIEAAVQKMKES